MVLKVLRWLLLLPVTAAVWYLSLMLGIVLLDVADGFCPPEQVVSGYCNAPWYPYAEAAIFYLCSGLAAIFWVLMPAIVAPVWRRNLAWVAFALGALVAGAMALHLAAWDDMAISLVAGFLTAWWIQRARWSAP